MTDFSPEFVAAVFGRTPAPETEATPEPIGAPVIPNQERSPAKITGNPMRTFVGELFNG